MNRRKQILYLSLIMFCLAITSAPFLLVTHKKAEQMIVLILSAEAFTPVLVLGMALMAHLIPWARKI